MALTPVANIDIQKEIIKNGSAKGDEIRYKITYKNNGTNAIGAFTITDYRPGTLEYLPSSPTPPFSAPYGSNSCLQGCDLVWYLNGLAI